MAYKTNDAIKRHLQEQWEAVCNGYLLELCNMWDINAKDYGYWIGNEIGGTWAYGDTGLFINLDNIKYCVENDISYSTYMEWLDYSVWASDFGFDTPNLKSWCKGCPRVDVATQERLSAMRFQLNKMIEEEKSKF